MPDSTQSQAANATEFLDAAYDGAGEGGADSQASSADTATKERDSGRDAADGASEGGDGHETAGASGRREQGGDQGQGGETLTRSAFDQAMKQASSEQARFFQEQLSRINERHAAEMRSLRSQFSAHRQRQQAQPKKPVLMPIADWMEQGGSRQTYEILSGIIDQHDQKYAALQQQVDGFHRSYREQDLAGKIERHITVSVDDVYKEFPEIAADNEFRDLLEGSVIAHMTAVAQRGQDTTKYDVRSYARGVAKKIDDLANKRMEAMRQKALGPKGGAPAKGSPTRATPPEADYKNTRDFLERGLASVDIAREFGMDDES
jgi:hypothetical protein